jgi:hypothetical protein
MKKQTALFLLPITAAASILLFAAPSRAFLIATAARRFTGSACVQVSSGGALKITANDGAIYNDLPSGSANLTVECPVLSYGHENTTNPPAADLWYLDNSTSSISCTFKAEDQLGVAVRSQTATSTGDDNNYRKMTFNVSSFWNGFSHIRCSIPPRDSSGNASYIIGYAGW